jgi:hypothetical protein
MWWMLLFDIIAFVLFCRLAISIWSSLYCHMHAHTLLRPCLRRLGIFSMKQESEWLNTLVSSKLTVARDSNTKCEHGEECRLIERMNMHGGWTSSSLGIHIRNCQHSCRLLRLGQSYWCLFYSFKKIIYIQETWNISLFIRLFPVVTLRFYWLACNDKQRWVMTVCHRKDGCA